MSRIASPNACSSHGWRDLSAGVSAVSILDMHATKRHRPFWAISGSGRPCGVTVTACSGTRPVLAAQGLNLTPRLTLAPGEAVDQLGVSNIRGVLLPRQQLLRGLGTNWEPPALAAALYGSVPLTCARP